MFEKIILFCLVFVIGVGKANAGIPATNFAEIEPIDYTMGKGDPFSHYLKSAAEARQMELENQIMEEQLIIMRIMRENAANYAISNAKTYKPKTVRVRGYYRKNGTYVKPHYRSSPTKKNVYKRKR